jgi:hypothetical protein
MAKVFLVTRAAIEYGHLYVEADSEEEAIQKAKEDAQFNFDAYEDDGVLEELTKGAITEYDAEEQGGDEPDHCPACEAERKKNDPVRA